MLRSNLLCALIALVTALTISSAFAHGYLVTTITMTNTISDTQINN